MADVRLFTAIHIPETPFVNEIVRPKKIKKYKYELAESKKIADTLFHYIYKKEEKQLHCYYLIADLEDALERYLFVENNDLYDDFVSRFWGGGQRYWESGMDTYLDVKDPEDVLNKLKHAHSKHFYEEDEPTPLCHIFGQQMWHGSACLIANQTALIELREAIDVALEHKESRVGLSPSDGEGYDLFIKCVEDDFEWGELEMPYHDRECYVPDETEERSPYNVFKKYKHHLD
ncbi:hypothetical protein AB1K32_17120 [Metabacillus dongyingensis]|uniref:hypothetical protein n=1 Tax=Metabacillus dongyingensis TaxID=2874282 RepID=UPI003B8CA2A4